MSAYTSLADTNWQSPESPRRTWLRVGFVKIPSFAPKTKPFSAGKLVKIKKMSSTSQTPRVSRNARRGSLRQHPPRLLVSATSLVMTSLLNQHVLVLNRLWQAVNVCTARRALMLLFQGHAEVVLSAEDGSFRTYDFREWHSFSQQQPHPESIHTISFKIRLPRVILLGVYDRLPKKEVKFTRHNIFERDKNTCTSIAARFSTGANRTSTTSCRATGAVRRRGKTLSVPACPAIRTRPTARRPRRACALSENPSGPSGARLCRSISACTSTTAGGTLWTWPIGTWNWVKMSASGWILSN